MLLSAASVALRLPVLAEESPSVEYDAWACCEIPMEPCGESGERFLNEASREPPEADQLNGDAVSVVKAVADWASSGSSSESGGPSATWFISHGSVFLLHAPPAAASTDPPMLWEEPALRCCLKPDTAPMVSPSCLWCEDGDEPCEPSLDRVFIVAQSDSLTRV
jgi:hypothetical protein